MTEDDAQKVVSLVEEIQRLKRIVRWLDAGWNHLARVAEGIHSPLYAELDDFLLDAIRESAEKRIAELENELAQL